MIKVGSNIRFQYNDTAIFSLWISLSYSNNVAPLSGTDSIAGEGTFQIAIFAPSQANSYVRFSNYFKRIQFVQPKEH